MSTLASLIAYVAVAAISFATLGLLFVPLERAFAARPQRVLRPGFGTDMVFFFGQHLIWSGAVLSALNALSAAWHAVGPRAVFVAFEQLAFWQQALLALVLGDVLLYWGHRLQHRVPLLWRYHRIHHTAAHLDWLAAYREHPLDGLYTRTLVNLPAILMGFPFEAIAGGFVFRGLWAVLIHSNVSLSPGPLKYLLGSPHLHLWHHAQGAHPGHNFANLMPLLDVVFGTYYEPARAPDAIGEDGDVPATYLGHLVQPFKP